MSPLPRPATTLGGDPEAEPAMPSGTAAALEAAGTGLVVLALAVLLAWATDARSSAGTAEVVRVAAQGWLLAHHVPLAVPGGTVALVPGGLALLPVLLLARAGAALAQVRPPASLRDAARLAGCLALPYAACAGVVALVAVTGAARPHPVVAAAAAGLHAALAGGLGAVLRGGLLPALAARLSRSARAAARAGALAAAALLGAGALLAGLALAASAGEAAALAGAVSPGTGGAVGLLLVGLVAVPNVVVWAAAWLAGPGFALGAGTSVTPAGTALAHVPALPLAAALPAPGPAPPVLLLLLAVPVLAGALAGRRLVRRRAPGSRDDRRTLLTRAAGAGLVAGALLGVLAALAGGPLGPGLDPVGPSPWQVALAVAVEVAAGAAAVVARATRASGAGPAGRTGRVARRLARLLPGRGVAGSTDAGDPATGRDDEGARALGAATRA